MTHPLRRALLQSIVDGARAIFLAEAASIALLDAASGRFVFEAVAGSGQERLIGTGFPSGQGIAGTVVQTGDPVIIDDLSQDPRFARDVAAGTGYVPRAMMVAPLWRGEETAGVISVLDRGFTGRTSLEELEVLVVFATQAGLAVEASAAGEAPEGPAERLARRLDGLSPERRAAALTLLDALDELLSR